MGNRPELFADSTRSKSSRYRLRLSCQANSRRASPSVSYCCWSRLFGALQPLCSNPVSRHSGKSYAAWYTAEASPSKPSLKNRWQKGHYFVQAARKRSAICESASPSGLVTSVLQAPNLITDQADTSKNKKTYPKDRLRHPYNRRTLHIAVQVAPDGVGREAKCLCYLLNTQAF